MLPSALMTSSTTIARRSWPWTREVRLVESRSGSIGNMRPAAYTEVVLWRA